MKYLGHLFLALVAVFAPIEAAVVSTFIVVLADLLTGALAARKRGEAITSAGFRRTVAKLCIYETALVLAFITQTFLTGEAVPLCKLVACMIGLTEIKSVLENLDILAGSAFFESIIKRLGSKNDEA